MHTMTRIIGRGLPLAACVIYLAMPLLPVSGTAAANSAPALGTVTAWGYNGYGQLGDGTTTSSSKPVSVIFPSGVTASAIDAGAFHSLAVTNGGLYAWGYNLDGELGDGTTTSRTTPVKVAFPSAVTTVTAIAAGAAHTLAITNDGLYAWGYNGSGQLGDGTTNSRTTPVKIAFPSAVTTVTAIAAGFYHSLAITNDGVYAWGDNIVGALGDGTRANRTTPVKSTFPSTVTAVTAIAAGFDDSLAITNDGPYAWGYNFYGELGDGTTTEKLAPVKIVFPPAVTTVGAIAAGAAHNLAITNDGLYAWGSDNFGQLGDGAATFSRTSPVKITFPKAVTVSALAAGSSHSLAITTDGLYAWGSNVQGQLGITGKNRYTPTKVQAESNDAAVSAGYFHSLALH